MSEPLDFEVRQEPDSVASASLVRVAVTAVLVGAAGVFFAWVILRATGGLLGPEIAARHAVPAAPRSIARIEQEPIRDAHVGVDRSERQRRALRGWGWVDRAHGVATIPIDRAIDLVVQEDGR